MKKLFGLQLIIFLTLISGKTSAQSKLVFEIGTGIPYNFPLPLTIKQNGESTIQQTAEFDSRPFEIPILWDLRISYWSGSNGWELEAIHHKLFLRNKPTEVQQFDISHGINLVIINRCFLKDDFIFKAGAGISLAHPENVVRGKKLDEQRGIFEQGYYVSGPAFLFSAGKRLYLIEKIFFSVEAKLALSYSNVPVADGTADVYNIAAMITFGIGTDFLNLN